MLPAVLFNRGNIYNIDYDSTQYEYFQNAYNSLNYFEIKPQQYIVYGNKYVVFMDVETDFKDDGVFKYSFCKPVDNAPDIELDARLYEDSGEGLVHWIINWTTESFTYDHIDFDILIKSLNVKSPSQITLVTGAYLEQEFMPQEMIDNVQSRGVNLLSGDTLRYVLFTDENIRYNKEHFYKARIEQIERKLKPRFRSVCYNRRARPHRILILAHMRSKGYIDSCIHSLGDHAPRGEGNSYSKNEPYFDYLSDDVDYYINHEGFVTPVIGEQDIDLDFNHAPTVFLPHAMNSTLHIVTETVPEVPYNSSFITEKSYKPFLMMQPFIQFGDVNNIEVLRRKGFRTFDRWINHDYDKEPDHKTRMIKFLAELDRLHSMSDEWWSETLIEMLGDLTYNFEQMHKQDKDPFAPACDLIPILTQFKQS